jgi:pyridoxine kinase
LNILSIHSHVSFGHVGNSAAVFALQRLGCEVWPVHTVSFSNHPGHGSFAGRVVDAKEVETLIAGLDKLGVLAQCDGVLSGYLGSPETGPVILSAVDTIRRLNPAALYCCDPVLGDTGTGIYVRPGLPEFMRQRAVPAADILTPNQFELETLSGRSVGTRADLVAALTGLHRQGPKIILVTSVVTQETPADAVDLVVSDGRRAYRLRTPRLGAEFNGAGDMIAALFLFHYVRKRDAAAALAAAASSVFGVLQHTLRAGSRELALIAAQDELVSPSRNFAAEPIGDIAENAP